MSSIINTNITSLIAQNNLSMSQTTLQTTIQRLSSGLRVNTAADDASGYAIANRMDAQVRGMAVATRNANDAISFSQTTTGALSQISNDLQRMRELAVQAANGSNSSSDTSLLNQEFSQLQTEVSRIQSSTQFNNVNVFAATDTVFQVGANTTAGDRVNMQGSPLVSTASLGTQTITDRTATTASADLSAAITSATAVSGANIASVYNATTDAINSSQKLSFTAKNDALNVLNNLNAAYNNGKSSNSNLTNFVTDLTNIFVTTAAAAGPKFVALTLLSSTTTGTTAASGLPSAGGTQGSTFQNDATTNTALTTGGTYAAGTSNLNLGVTYTATTGGTLQIYIGSSTGSAAGSLAATQTAASGQTLAQSAIGAIDSALTEVNTASAIQGALQNRFTAVISNLTAFSQSQTAAKSRIVDADFAAETAKLSKNQILQQAGTAMLAQANQLPSGILSLLKNG